MREYFFFSRKIVFHVHTVVIQKKDKFTSKQSWVKAFELQQRWMSWKIEESRTDKSFDTEMNKVRHLLPARQSLRQNLRWQSMLALHYRRLLCKRLPADLTERMHNLCSFHHSRMLYIPHDMAKSKSAHCYHTLVRHRSYDIHIRNCMQLLNSLEMVQALCVSYYGIQNKIFIRKWNSIRNWNWKWINVLVQTHLL